MADISIVFDGVLLRGDFVLGPMDIQTGNDLQTAILISLFTNPGWWADAYEPDAIGCKLLELRRSKHTQDTLNRARDYCRAALKWLLDDKVARAVDVGCAWKGSCLAIAVTLFQPAGKSLFSFEWEAV